MFPRTGFDQQHTLFRETAPRFVEKRILPYQTRWEHERKIGRLAPSGPMRSDRARQTCI